MMAIATAVTLGTATPGGGFPVYGDAVAATVNATDPSLDVKTRNTKGSTENVPRLEAGTRGSGLVILARYVLDGLGLDQQRDFQAVFLDAAGHGPTFALVS